MVDVKQTLVVRIKIRTYLRVDATGTAALLAGIKVAPMHTIHICRRTTQITEITLEVRHLNDLLHLF